MFKPTPAERKTMISKLPPASEGKVWKRLTEGKMRAGDHTFCVASGIHYIGEITVGAPFDGAPVSKLENYQSAWRLVAARKRSPETVYYCPKDGDTRWTAKLCGFFDHTYRSSGVYESNGDETAPMFSRGARGNIESGMWKTISRTEFLSRIKGYGLNEDGTKMAAPPPVPEVKYVVNASMGTFSDCAFLRVNADGSITRVHKDRREENWPHPKWIEDSIKDGSWKYVSESEAKALLPKVLPPKTELELAQEALTAANARIATLEAQIASAKEVLS